MVQKQDKLIMNINDLLTSLRNNQQNKKNIYVKVSENPFCPQRSLYFTEIDLEKYNKICLSLSNKLNQDSLPGYSDYDIKNKFDKWLSESLDSKNIKVNKKYLREVIKDWKGEMNISRSYIFLVTGVILPKSRVEIDEDDYFTDTDNIKDSFDVNHLGVLKDIFSKNEPILVVTVKGSKNEKTYETAKRKANRIIGLVNLINSNKFLVRIFIINKVIVKNDIDEYYGFEKDKGWFGRSKVKKTIPQLQLFYTSDTFSKFKYLIDVQKEKELSKLQRKICSALDWLNLSNNSNKSMSFLQAMIALETILETNSNDISIVSQISMSIYTILGKNIDDKKKLKSFIKQSYDVRSKIGHNGYDEVSSDFYYKLCHIMFQLINKLVNDKELCNLKDTEDLWNYVELKLMQ